MARSSALALTRRTRQAILVAAALLSQATGVEAGIAVAGRVVTPPEQQVPGVVVELTPLVDELERPDLTRKGSSDAERHSMAAVGPDGYFRLEAPGKGMWKLRAIADGYVPAEIELVPLIESIVLPPLQLQVATELRIRIHPATEENLEDYRVLAAAGEKPSFVWGFADRYAPFDRQGTATLLVGRQEKVDLGLFRKVFLGEIKRGVGAGEIEWRIPALKGCDLKIRRSSSEPLAGALVRDRAVGWPLGWSDRDGKLSLNLPAGADRQLEILLADGSAHSIHLDGWQLGATCRRRVEVPMPVVLAGRVIDSRSREGIAEALVWSSADPAVWAVTSGSGGYRLPVKKGQSIELRSVSDRHLESTKRWFPSLRMPARGPTLVLQPAGARVAGKVVSSTGAPIPEARIAAKWAGLERSSFSERQGAFTLHRLQAGDSLSLAAAKTGYTSSHRTIAGLAARQTLSGIEFELSPGVTVRGTIQNGNREPIVGAEVFLHPSKEGRPAITREDGVFTFSNLVPRRYRLEARATGYASSSRRVDIADHPTETSLGVLTLVPGLDLKGYIRAEDSSPIAGAVIFITKSGSSQRSLDGKPAREPDAASAHDGTFVVTDLGPGVTFGLEVWARGFQRGTIPAISVPRPDPIAVTLERGGSVSGHVLDPHRELLGGASVSIFQERDTHSNGSEPTFWTEKDGLFHFEHVGPGTTRLAVVAPGFTRYEPASFSLSPGEDLADLELVLEPGGLVEGYVFEPDGLPAVGASVRVLPDVPGKLDFSLLLLTTSTDGDGYYHLAGVPLGARAIEAKHEEFSRVVKDLEVLGGSQDLNFVLEPEASYRVSGRVIDEEGRPRQDARLHMAPARGGVHRETVSGSEGGFEFDKVPLGRYELVAQHPDSRRTSTRMVSVVSAPVDGLEIQLNHVGLIEGRLLRLAGEELPRVRVTASASEIVVGRVDVAAGTYRISGVPPGRWSVEASIEDGPRALGVVDLDVGEEIATLDLEFDNGITFEAEILSEHQPFAGVRVDLRGLDRFERASATTDAAGRIRFTGLEPGNYLLEVREPSHSGRLMHHERLELVSDQELTLSVDPSTMAGRIRDGRTSDPIARAEVTIDYPPEKRLHRGVAGLSAVTDDRGRFFLKPVAAGDWRLIVRKSGYQPIASSILIEPGQHLDDLELEMNRSAGLELEITLPSNEPPTSVAATIADVEGRVLSIERHYTAEHGRVLLSTVPAGTWTVQVRSEPAGFVGIARYLTVPGPVVMLELRTSGQLAIVVPELAGESIRAELHLRDASGRPALRGSGAAVRFGRAFVQDLVPGVWNVEVSTTDDRSWSGTVALFPASTSTLELH